MKSYYWIKLYHEILDDAKMGRLPDRLWRRAIELFLMAGEEHNEGHLPALADMAWRLRLDDNALLEDLQALAQIDIVTQLEDGSWFVTHFADRQGAVSNAERQQRYRDRQRKGQYYGNEGADDDGNEPVTICNTDVDVDRDVDKDVDVELHAFRLYEQAAGILSPLIAEQLGDLVDEFEKHRQDLPASSEGAKHSGDEWVQAAIKETGKAGARISINYLKAILDRWRAEGFQAPRSNGQGTSGTLRIMR